MTFGGIDLGDDAEDETEARRCEDVGDDKRAVAGDARTGERSSVDDTSSGPATRQNSANRQEVSARARRDEGGADRGDP